RGHPRRPDRRQRRIDHHPGARAVRAMTQDAALDRLVRRVAAQVRWRRIEHYALRGFFWASLPAVALLVLKGILGPQALPAAAVLLVAGALLGALWGAFKRTTRADAARLADRAFGLEDRVATALEWAGRPDRTPMVDALVAAATARVEQLPSRRIVRRILPREAHFLPAPLLVALTLTLAPALPLPSPRLPDFTPGGPEDDKEQRTGSGALEERAKTETREGLRPPAFEGRGVQGRGGAWAGGTPGELAAGVTD